MQEEQLFELDEKHEPQPVEQALKLKVIINLNKCYFIRRIQYCRKFSKCLVVKLGFQLSNNNLKLKCNYFNIVSMNCCLMMCNLSILLDKDSIYYYFNSIQNYKKLNMLNFVKKELMTNSKMLILINNQYHMINRCFEMLMYKISNQCNKLKD